MSRRYFSDIPHQPTTSSVASKCIVCECTLNPKILQFVACGHHFCSRCFESLKSNSPLKGTNLRCPVIDGVMNLDKEFGRSSYQLYIDDFRLKCSFAKRGCHWYGRLDNLQAHKSRCNFSIIQNNPSKQSSAPKTNHEAVFQILVDFEKKLSKKDKEYESIKKTEKETATLVKGLSERLVEAERKLRLKDEEVISLKEDVKSIKETMKKYPAKFDKITKNLVTYFGEKNDILEKKIDLLKNKLESNVNKKETNKLNENSEKLKEKFDLLFKNKNEKDDKLDLSNEKYTNIQLKFDGMSKVMKVNENNLLLLNEKNKKLKEKFDLLTHKFELNEKEILLLVERNETIAETNKKEIDLLNVKNKRLQEKMDVLVQSLTANDFDKSKSEKVKSDFEGKINGSEIGDEKSLEKTLCMQENLKTKRYKKIHQLVSSYESLCCVGELQKTSSTVLLRNSDNRDVVLMDASKNSDENSNYLNSSQSTDHSSNEYNDHSNKQQDRSMTSNDSSNLGHQSLPKTFLEDSGNPSEVDFRIMDQSKVENVNNPNLADENESDSFSADDSESDNEKDNIMYNDNEMVKISIHDFKNYMKELDRTEKGKAIKKLKNNVRIINRQVSYLQAEAKKTQKKNATKDSQLGDVIALLNKKLDSFENNVQNEEVKLYQQKEKEQKEDIIVDTAFETMIAFDANDDKAVVKNGKKVLNGKDDFNRRLADLERKSKPVTDIKLNAIFDLSERIKELENLTCSLLQKEKYQKVANSFQTSKSKEKIHISDVDEGVCSLSEADEMSRSNEQLNKSNKIDCRQIQAVIKPTKKDLNLDSSPVDIYQRVNNIEKSIKHLNEVQLAVRLEDRINKVEAQVLPLIKQVKLGNDIDTLGKKTLDEITTMKNNMAKNVNLVNESYECILNQMERYKTDERGSCTELTKTVSVLKEKVEFINEGLNKCMKDVEGSKITEEVKKCFDLYYDLKLKYVDLVNTRKTVSVLEEKVEFLNEGLNKCMKDVEGTKSTDELKKCLDLFDDMKLKYQDLVNTNSLNEHNERILDLEIRIGSAEELIKIINTKNSGYSFNQIQPSTHTYKSGSDENKKSILDLRKSLTELENRLLFVFNHKIKKVEESTMKMKMEAKELISYEDLQKKINSFEAEMISLKDSNKKSFDDIETKLTDMNSNITKSSVSNDGNFKNSTASTNKKIHNLESQMQSSKDLYKNLNNTVNDVKKRLTTVEGKLSEYKALNDTLQEHEDCLKDLVDGIESAEKQILDLEEKVGGLTKVSSGEKSAGSKAQNEDKLHCQRLNSLEYEKVKMKSELAELQMSLNKKETALLLNDDNLKKEFNALKKTLHDQDKMKSELDGIKKTLNNQDKMKSELDGIKKTLNEQDKMKSELDCIKKRLNEQDKIKSELDGIKKKLNEQDKMKSELDGIKKTLNNQDKIKLELDGIKKTLNDQDKIKLELDGIKKTLNDQDKIKLELDGIKKTLNNQDKIKLELDGIKKTLNDQDIMKFELDDLAKTLLGQGKLRTELDDLKKTLHDQNEIRLELNRLKKSTQDQKNIRSEVDDLKKSLQSQKKMRSELDKLNKIRNDSNEMRLELNELKKSLHDHKKMRSELDKLNKTRSDSNEMRSELNELKKLLQDHKTMRSELDKLNISNYDSNQIRLEFDALRISYQDTYRRTSEFAASVKKELKNFDKVKSINDDYLGKRLTDLENSVKMTKGDGSQIKDDSQFIELTKTVEKLNSSLKGLWKAAVVTVKDESKEKKVELVDVKKQHREDFDLSMDSFEAYCKDYIMNTFDDLEVKFTMFKDFIKDENINVVKALGKNSKEIDRILKTMADYEKDLKETKMAVNLLKDNYESDFNHISKNVEPIETNFQFNNALEKRIQDMEDGIACLENFLSITNMRVQRLRRNFGENESDTESDDEISVNRVNENERSKNTSYNKSGDSFSIITQEEIKDDKCFRNTDIDFKKPIAHTSDDDTELENLEIVLILQELISVVETREIECEKIEEDYEKIYNSKETSTESLNRFTDITMTFGNALEDEGSENQIVVECLKELTTIVENSLKGKSDKPLDKMIKSSEGEAPILLNESSELCETDPQNESWILLPDEKPEEKGPGENNVA